jgi:hypothetical protein
VKRGFPLGPRYVVAVGEEIFSARPGSLYRAGVLLEQLVKRGMDAHIMEVPVDDALRHVWQREHPGEACAGPGMRVQDCPAESGRLGMLPRTHGGG